MKKTSTIYSIAILAILSVVLFSACKKPVELNPDGATVGPNTISVPDSTYFYIIAYYPFNESGYDYSGYTANLAFSSISSAPDRNGNPDAAYYFNGVNSSARSGNSSLEFNNNNFTINVWVNLDSYGGPYGSAILSRRGAGPDNGWMFMITNGAKNNASKSGLLSFVPGSTDNYAIDTTSLALHHWYMVTTTYDAKLRKCSFYINGVLSSVTNNIKSPFSNVVADLYIGRDNPVNTSEPYFFNGTMDDLRVYSRVITVSEINKLMARGDG